MRRRHLRVRLSEANDWASIAGFGAKDLVEEAGGRPIWSNIQRAWMTNTRVATDALAIADRRGWSVTYTEDGVS